MSRIFVLDALLDAILDSQNHPLSHDRFHALTLRGSLPKLQLIDTLVLIIR